MKYKALKVGFSRRTLIITSSKVYKLRNDFSYKLNINSGVIFGKRKNLKGTAIIGIMTNQIMQRKYLLKSSLLI